MNRVEHYIAEWHKHTPGQACPFPHPNGLASLGCTTSRLPRICFPTTMGDQPLMHPSFVRRVRHADRQRQSRLYQQSLQLDFPRCIDETLHDASMRLSKMDWGDFSRWADETLFKMG
jgi:hypothetical protein